MGVIIYALFGLGALCAVLSDAFIKIYRSRIDDEKVKDSMHYILMIVVALALFATLAGFDLRVNLATLIFAAIYAAVAYISVLFKIHAIECAELVTISIATNAGSVLWSFVWGTTLFNEAFTVNRCLGIIAVLVAVITSYFSERTGRKCNMKGVIYCLLIFFTAGLGSLVLKSFAADKNVMSQNVFFFYTNIFLIPVPWFMFRKSISVKGATKAVAMIDMKTILIAVLALILSNTNTIISWFTIKKVDLVVCSIMNQSFGILITAIISRMMFKEKINLAKLISIIFLIGAIIITAI